MQPETPSSGPSNDSPPEQRVYQELATLVDAQSEKSRVQFDERQGIKAYVNRDSPKALVLIFERTSDRTRFAAHLTRDGSEHGIAFAMSEGENAPHRASVGAVDLNDQLWVLALLGDELVPFLVHKE